MEQNAVWPHIWKRFSKLIVPLLFITFIAFSFQIFKGQSFINVTKFIADSLFWSSGVSVKGHPCLGMPWFLVSLMTAGCIIDFANWKIHNRFYKITVFLVLTFFGFLLGKFQYWLPLNFDVTLVCAGFIYIGMLLKIYSEYLKRYKTFIILFCCLIWLFLIKNGVYIELASRHYPGWVVSFVEAIFATIVICYISKTFEAYFLLCNFFATIGRHTLMIFTIHAVDWLWFPMITERSWVITAIIRVLIDLSISAFFIFVIHVLNGRAKNIIN